MLPDIVRPPSVDPSWSEILKEAKNPATDASAKDTVDKLKKSTSKTNGLPDDSKGPIRDHKQTSPVKTSSSKKKKELPNDVKNGSNKETPPYGKHKDADVIENQNQSQKEKDMTAEQTRGRVRIPKRQAVKVQVHKTAPIVAGIITKCIEIFHINRLWLIELRTQPPKKSFIGPSRRKR